MNKKEIIKRLKDIKGLRYIYQYAASYETDDMIADKLADSVVNNFLDVDQVIELLNNMEQSDDTLNNVIYKNFIFNLNDELIKLLDCLYKNYDDSDFYGFLDCLNIGSYYEVLAYDDLIIGSPAKLAELADDDFKISGIEAAAVNWYYKLDHYIGHGRIVVIDCYNSVETLEVQDLLNDFIADSQFIELLKKY